MKIMMKYENGSIAYYRKQGIFCFDFVSDKDLASDLTEAECDSVRTFGNAICKQYGCTEITVVE